MTPTCTWHEIPDHYPGIELDVMQIMPNHLHGIITICEVGTAPRGRPYPGIENGQARGPVPTGCLSLSDVIERYKSFTTKRYIDGVNTYGWHPFSGKLWQRSYHDRIIRNETKLNKIRTYICNNPSEWDTDENNIDFKQKNRISEFIGTLSAALIHGVLVQCNQTINLNTSKDNGYSHPISSVQRSAHIV